MQSHSAWSCIHNFLMVKQVTILICKLHIPTAKQSFPLNEAFKMQIHFLKCESQRPHGVKKKHINNTSLWVSCLTKPPPTTATTFFLLCLLVDFSIVLRVLQLSDPHGVQSKGTGGIAELRFKRGGAFYFHNQFPFWKQIRATDNRIVQTVLGISADTKHLMSLG